MKTQYYFRHSDSEVCYDKSYFEDEMADNGIDNIEVYEAIPEKWAGVFWCQVQHFCGEDSRDTCGKQCLDYSPRNGKNGCCRFYSAIVYTHGSKITLHLNKEI